MRQNLLSCGAALPLFLSCVFGLSSSTTFESDCAALATQLDLPNTQVKFTQYLAPGFNLSIPDYPESCITATGAAPFQAINVDTCRVVLLINTSESSNVTLEAWLPLNWTGRFLSGGNGGLTGCIQYVDLSYGTSSGFATVSGNNGHNGSSGADFYQNPGILEDYAYRAIYTGGVIGKQVAAAFYRTPVSKSYFMGCSGGGRQGLKLAQSFPEVFDGIVAASPAIDFNNFISWGTWLAIRAGLDPQSPDFINESLWEVIHDEVLRQCDGIDGAVDGILEDPDLCLPKFETLICSGNETDSRCLSGAQAEKARLLYEPLYGNNGTLLYPRLQPGTEIETFKQSYFSGQVLTIDADWWKYVVYDPSFDPDLLTLDDLVFSDALNPFNIRTFDTNLTAFSQRGGRLLSLHGLEDFIISSEISSRYYDRVAEDMSMPPSALDQFYRHFRVSGMSHCALGNGAYSIGMYSFGLIDNAMEQSPDDNVLARIVAWVEQDDAPEYIRGTSFISGLPGSGTAFTRKHCKYPARNVYVGPENYTDENAWQCV